MVDTKDSGECSTTAKTVERDDRVVENIGLVFERPHEQLESIEQSLEAVGTWASHTFEQLRPVLQRLRQELLLEFSPTDERLEVFEGLLSLSVDFAKSKPNSYTQLQYVLTQLLKFVNRSIKATEEVARNTSRVEGSSGVNNGSRKGDSGNEVAEWQTVTTRFFRELAQSQSQGDMEHMAQKYLVVVHSIKPNLEVLESAIGLLNRLKAERLEMEQGLDKRTKPQGFVKEAPRAEDSEKGFETDHRITLEFRKQYKHIQEMIQRAMDDRDANIGATVKVAFSASLKEFKDLGTIGKNINRASVVEILRSRETKVEKPDQLSVLNRIQRKDWRTTKIAPPLRHNADKGTRAWADIETASQFLEVIVENGYPIDEKGLKDIYISAAVFAPLQDWMSAEEGGWLWLHRLPSSDTVSNVSVAAAYAVTLTKRLKLPTVAYRFRANESGLAADVESGKTGRSVAMDRFVLMTYSFVRQLIWLLPEQIETEMDLGAARFQRMDRSTSSIRDVFNFIEGLLSFMRHILFVVIDGFQYIDNDGEEGVECTWNYLDEFLGILRKAGQGPKLKVILSSDGICKTLSGEDVVGFQERVEIGKDE